MRSCGNGHYFLASVNFIAVLHESSKVRYETTDPLYCIYSSIFSVVMVCFLAQYGWRKQEPSSNSHGTPFITKLSVSLVCKQVLNYIIFSFVRTSIELFSCDKSEYIRLLFGTSHKKEYYFYYIHFLCVLTASIITCIIYIPYWHLDQDKRLPPQYIFALNGRLDGDKCET